MDTIPKSSIILNWREISTNYLHSLAKSSINHIIAEGKDKMMGGYAFIEDMDLGTRAPEIHLESIDALSENYAKARVTFRYDSDLHVKAQAYQQINPLHYTQINPPGSASVRHNADGTITKLSNPKIRRRGRLLMHLCESDYPSYVNAWGLVFDLKLAGAMTIEYVNNLARPQTSSTNPTTTTITNTTTIPANTTVSDFSFDIQRAPLSPPGPRTASNNTGVNNIDNRQSSNSLSTLTISQNASSHIKSVTPLFVPQSPEPNIREKRGIFPNDSVLMSPTDGFASVRPIFMKSLDDSLQTAFHSDDEDAGETADADASASVISPENSNSGKNTHSGNEEETPMPLVYLRLTLLPYDVNPDNNDVKMGNHSPSSPSHPIGYAHHASPFPLQSVSVSCAMDHSVLLAKILAKAEMGIAKADEMLRKTGYCITIPLVPA